MAENSEKLVVIDGNSIFYRSFYALPLLSNSNGEYSNAIYGFAMQILNIIQNIKPNYMVVAFDAGKHTFRNDLYDGYKATRKPMPDELRSQIQPLKNMLNLMNIKIVEKIGYEGDDIIGIISKRFSDVETIIVTGDRDSFQLVDNTTKVYFTKKGTSDVKIMGVEELKKEFGVSPELFIDLKALQGDSSDNIPGVAGIGPKTATDLILKYGDLDGIYSNIESITGKTKEKLINGKELAYLSKKLATILTQSDDIDLSISDCNFDFPFSSDVYNIFKHYEFKSLLKNKNIFSSDEIKTNNIEENFKVHKILKISEFDKIIKNIIEEKKFAFYYLNEEYHISLGEVEYTFVVTYDLFGESIDLFAFFEKFKPIFESNDIVKICFNAKKDMHLLKNYNCELENYFDCAIAKYLVDGVPVDSVLDILFDEDKTFIASKLYNFANEYKNKIKEENLEFLFYEVELPLSKVLFSMENYGFKVDKTVMDSLKNKYYVELKSLEKEIYNYAGEEFNINSPKQLAHILYEKLGLPHGKKQSTSAEKLEEISGMHGVVNSVLRYRKVAKFLGTYIDGLANHLDKNNFIHTSFTQTLTTTGRLSSVEPNLQNIPIRSEESREIRSMFVASTNESVLVDADYSQIELRLLAHLSEDPEFIDAFENNIDIHSKTACNVFGVSKELVTPEMRRTAKIVNFGIIYGISDYGLAEDLKIGYKDAKKLIDSFYALHPAIRNYMDNQVKIARETGKAQTLFGRTRKMLDINSSNFMLRQRVERASQNMPLQGTAADIIKIAMVKTFNALKENNLKAKLIMQVHDELIIDSPVDELEKVKIILKEQMENATKLKVKLEVDVQSSYRWSDGH